jgi:DNA-directed RNA polymerase specialized sigma24 family protein
MRMITPIPASATFSTEEIKEAIISLSDANMRRLHKIAMRYCSGRLDPDDLLQESFAAALDGRRNCPRNVDVVCFLAGAIRSLASSQFKSLQHSPELHIIATQNDDCEDTQETDWPSEAPNADQMLISEQEAAAIHAAVLSLFTDDEIAKLIVEGEMEDMDANEIYELTGLDKTAYASKRRLIRRRIDKAYPEGWKL